MIKSSLKRNYEDYLFDISDAINKIEKFCVGFDLEKFSQDEKTQDAVIRRFEIIGEAVNNIPTKVKNRYKEIPWKEMAGMRNKLVHEYFGVDKKVVWKTIKEDVPELKEKILKIIKDLKINRINYL